MLQLRFHFCVQNGWSSVEVQRFFFDRLNQWFLTFFVSFSLYQSQKLYFTPNNIYCVMSRHEFSEKGLGEVVLEKRKLTLRYMNFCAYWNQFW